MKVAILSDTHIDKDLHKIINFAEQALKEVDFIIHAGDYKNSKVIYLLKKYNNFAGVWGNNDGETVKSLVKQKEIIELSGYRIGICHGNGDKKVTIDNAYDQFVNDKVDIIVFGHSHRPLICTRKKILMLNPGSITMKRSERWFSYIVLELEKDKLDATLKFFHGK